MTRRELQALFGHKPPVIGMVHLLPLPGSPQFGGDLQAVHEAALQDAQALVEGGVSGLIIENFGDLPFYPDHVPAETVAVMTAIAQDIRRQTDVPIGINVLRNDARAALAIAGAVGAQFIRVNVFGYAYVTDQGVLESRAHEIMRLRRWLGFEVRVFADLFVKHAVPPGRLALAQAAYDLAHRSLADAVIVSGDITGGEIALDDLATVRNRLPEVAILAGSGATPENVNTLLQQADGLIVGSYFKKDRRARNRVDATRVRQLIDTIER
ncbi:MAG: BtpA/SgcQ family protein [candidate division KSB1 bacterium]|nr:BtpA/SgcQ family protein [candidate division KSB1 bacterium]